MGLAARIKRMVLDGFSLEYEDSGSGDPVVFIHGLSIADAFLPLLGEPGLSRMYRCIAYHRRGYRDSTQFKPCSQSAPACLKPSLRYGHRQHLHSTMAPTSRHPSPPPPPSGPPFPAKPRVHV